MPLPTEALQEALKNIVFCLEWQEIRDGPRGKPELGSYYGTGFFITAGGLALTAFHNLPERVLAEPDTPMKGIYHGQEIHFAWVLPEPENLDWQTHRDLAVLQAVRPPAGLQPIECVCLDPTLERRERELVWAGSRLLAYGFPKSRAFSETPIAATVSCQQAIADQKTLQHGRREDAASEVLNVNMDWTGGGLTGMSGSPVYDLEMGGVAGLLIGVDERVYVTELLHLYRYWEPARQLITVRNHKRRAVYPVPVFSWLRSWKIAAALAMLLIAAWAVWQYGAKGPPQPAQLAVSVLRFRGTPEGSRLFLNEPSDWSREPLREDARFTEGEHVRFAIRSTAAGYLYVVDREIGAGEETRQPYLIFPTRRTQRGRNQVEADGEILFPSPNDEPPYVQPRSIASDPSYSGELLTVLLFRQPLTMDLQETPFPLDPAQVPFFEGGSRLFEHPAAEPALALTRIRVAVAKTVDTSLGAPPLAPSTRAIDHSPKR